MAENLCDTPLIVRGRKKEKDRRGDKTYLDDLKIKYLVCKTVLESVTLCALQELV